MKNRRVIGVFVSSPSDVSEERSIVQDVIFSINTTVGRHAGYILEPIMWEKNITPNMGASAQDLINSQADDYEIFIGIMCARFGTPTAKYGSGTEEEFHLALAKKKSISDLPAILFYFKDARSSSVEIDPDQFKKVHDFRKSILDKGMHASFSDKETFTELLRTHLMEHARIILENTAVDTTKSMTQEPSMINGEVLLEEEELGILDLQALATDAFEAFGIKMNYLGAIQGKLGQSLTDQTNELLTLTSIPNPSIANVKSARRILDQICDTMDVYSQEVSTHVKGTQEAIISAIEFTMQAQSLSENIPGVPKEDPQEAARAIEGMIGILNASKSMVLSFKRDIASLPPLSARLNSSKKKISRAFDAIIDMVDATQEKALFIHQKILE